MDHADEFKLLGKKVEECNAMIELLRKHREFFRKSVIEGTATPRTLELIEDITNFLVYYGFE